MVARNKASRPRAVGGGRSKLYEACGSRGPRIRSRVERRGGIRRAKGAAEEKQWAKEAVTFL